MNKFINDVYIVVPVYNEEQVIEETLSNLKKRFKKIVVVNDGSTDGTKKIVEKFKNIILINHPLNSGQGLAISTGIKYVSQNTNAKAIITFDADGQHSVQDAVKFAKEILKCKEEIVFGSRFLNGDDQVPVVKKFFLKLVTKISNLILKMNLTDAHNGMNSTSCFNKIILK